MIPIFLALAFIAILFIVVIAGQPANFAVVRATNIFAPPEKIFPYVNDLRKWEAWSPWAKLDPNSKSTFEGPATGTGAAMAWVGNRKVGEGKMTITDSQPGQTISFRLDFQKPMKATNVAEFTFRPVNRGTELTWAMTGKNSLMGKIFGLFINCDKMVGGQFENGLANLKAVVEN